MNAICFSGVPPMGRGANLLPHMRPPMIPRGAPPPGAGRGHEF